MNCRAGTLRDEIGHASGYLRPRSRASHVSAGARVDLNRFALFDEERDVNGLAGFQGRRLSYVARSIAAHSLWRFYDFQTNRRGQLDLHR